MQTNQPKVVRLHIDSTSTGNTTPENNLKKKFPNIKVKPQKNFITAYSEKKASIQTNGDQGINPEGKVTFCCERKGKLHLLNFLIVDVPYGKPALSNSRDAVVLGYLKNNTNELHVVSKLGTDMISNGHNHQIQLGELTKEFVLNLFYEVFLPGREKALGAPMQIEMDPDVRLVHATRRRILVTKVQKD